MGNLGNREEQTGTTASTSRRSGLPASNSEVPAESSEEQEHSQRRRRPGPMSFDNDPGDENRGTTEFPHSSANLEEVVTPQKTSKQKGKKGSSSSTKKKRKRKRASPKKGSGNDKPDSEEVMSKLMAVKQMYVQNPMLIALSKEGQNSSSPTRWDVSAQTLLNMTLTFLRHVPERVVSHPKNRGIISRLLDLTSPEAVVSFRSRTIHWSSLMAVHLLHLCPVKLDSGFSQDASKRLARCAVKGSASSSTSTPTSVSRVSSPSKRKTSSAKRKRRSKRRSSTATAATRKHLFF